MSITRKIIIAILLAILFSVGLLTIKDYLGGSFDVIVTILNVVGSIFIRLLKFVIVPIVVVSLINGIINLESINQLRSLGLKTLFIFIGTTLVALFLAVTVSNLFNAGSAFANDESVLVTAKAVTKAVPPSMVDNIITLVPSNIIEPMLNTNMLQIVLISILLGASILMLPANQRHEVADSIHKAEKVVVGIINMIMSLAPYAIFALLSKTIVTQGTGIIWAMGQYVLITLFVSAIMVVGVFIPLVKLSGVRLADFIKKSSPAIAVAFSTASSSATLPVNLKVAESFKIDKAVSGFVLPLGSTVHMVGTAIMQGVSVVFLANLYGVEMSVWAYVGAVSLALTTTVGAAGVPGAGLIALTVILIQYNIPIEGIGIIMGVDRLMDMVRTAINVNGDLIVALLLSKKQRKNLG